MLVAGLLVACGDADDEPSLPTAAPATSMPDGSASSTTTTLPTDAAIANADGHVTTVLGTFPLRVSECDVGNPAAVRIVAETEDGAGHLEVTGPSDGALVAFTIDKGDGEPSIWTVADAVLVMDGTMFFHEGPSIVSGPALTDTMIAVTITCA